MKKFFTILFLFFVLTSVKVYSINRTSPKFPQIRLSQESDLESLENLIFVTEQNLSELKTLKEEILNYQSVLKKLLTSPNSEEMQFQTGIAAKKILDKIKKNHLMHTFEPRFISEISLYAKLGKKPSLQK